MDKCITITTDFGDDFAAAQIRAVMATLNHNGRVIENHSVTSFSITEGAFEIYVVAKYAPKGTVHLGCIDPGVGSERRAIIIKNSSSWFVGPDNGLLFPAATSAAVEKIWEIDEQSVSKQISHTFHCRDVFIKTAVYLAQGKKPGEFGSKIIPITQIKELFLNPGQVLHIDNYGNIKIYWPGDLPIGQRVRIKKNGLELNLPIVKTFSNVNPGESLSYRGSNDTLEIAINLGNAAFEYQINCGDTLEINSV